MCVCFCLTEDYGSIGIPQDFRASLLVYIAKGLVRLLLRVQQKSLGRFFSEVNDCADLNAAGLFFFSHMETHLLSGFKHIVP